MSSKRLPRNFHKTFIPERQYISAMLKYVAAGKGGNDQEISATTGIPTGTSSGKVPAIRDYCRGMGLIKLGNSAHSAAKQMELTPFGRIVRLEDPYLKERVTQWIAHFNLCQPTGGADVWYHVFCNGFLTLGMKFKRAQLEQFLSGIYGVEGSDIIGPLLRMYSDNSSFAICRALEWDKNETYIVRTPAPVMAEFAFAYGAWVLQLISDYFPTNGQVTVTELNEAAGLHAIPGWDTSELRAAIGLMERKNAVHVDRQMNPWILRPSATADELWGRIYDDIV